MQEAIKVEHLSKSYGNLKVIDNLNLSVKSGTVYGLLGANGAGKSTTIECVLGIKKADTGTVSILEHDPQKIGLIYFRKWVYNFRKAVIKRKLKLESCVKKQRASIRIPLIGKSYVGNLELETS